MSNDYTDKSDNIVPSKWDLVPEQNFTITVKSHNQLECITRIP